MPVLTEEIINTLGEFTNFIEATQAPSDCLLWYRGCCKCSHKLVPTLYRHGSITDIESLIDLEKQLINRFKQRSIPFQSREMKGDWDYLFFMQHFGVPTRLLDWTENPYIALYFALTLTGSTDDAAVWILKPCEWNAKALGFRGRNSVLSLVDSGVKGYVPASDPTFDLEIMNERPVAMYGTHNSPRIVAQRGVFTIFGKNTSPMEDIYIAQDFSQDSIIKVKVPVASVPSLLKSVISIGITDSVIFPDLDGLAKETKRFFGFEV